MMLAYWETTLIMSAKVSSLAIDDEMRGVVSVSTPPSLAMAVSKLIRVRVLSAEKKRRHHIPLHDVDRPVPWLQGLCQLEQP